MNTRLAAIVLGVIALASVAPAHASKAIFADVQFLNSMVLPPNLATYSATIQAPKTGMYKATLTDRGFPVPFDFLLMSIDRISDTTPLLNLQMISPNQGDMAMGDFLANAGDDLFLGIVGRPGVFDPGGTLDPARISRFGVKISLMPIPPAVVLFLSAIGGLAVLGRNRKQRAA